MSAPNLHPVRALEQRYPTLYRRRMLPCGAEIIQGRPGTRAYDKHDWDYASAADELIEEYGSIDNALKHACDGGLNLGGGAAPVFQVSFAP